MAEQKLERRERILAAARELIAERGYRDITVRDLAARCGVSVPTLYNQFGGKDALLAAAVESHFRAGFDALAEGDERPGPDRILGLVHRVAERTTELAEYHQSLLRAFGESAETAPIQQSLGVELTRYFVRELDEMASRGLLAAWVDTSALAVQVTTACISASVVWGQGQVGDQGLEIFMRHGVASLLLGAALGSARDELESVVQESQAQLASELADAAAASPDASRTKTA